MFRYKSVIIVENYGPYTYFARAAYFFYFQLLGSLSRLYGNSCIPLFYIYFSCWPSLLENGASSPATSVRTLSALECDRQYERPYEGQYEDL